MTLLIFLETSQGSLVRAWGSFENSFSTSAEASAETFFLAKHFVNNTEQLLDDGRWSDIISLQPQDKIEEVQNEKSSDKPYYSRSVCLLNTGVVFADPGPEKTIYVSITGSDTTGDGTQSNPYRTIQKGINAAIDGDTVSVTTGTYAELVSISKRVYLVGVGTPTIDPPSDGDVVTFSGM